jgi:carbamoyl-phosphate synthase large subunit
VQGVPCLTTAAAALAAASGIVDRAAHELRVRTLQEFHAGIDRDQPRLPLDA